MVRIRPKLGDFGRMQPVRRICPESLLCLMITTLHVVHTMSAIAIDIPHILLIYMDPHVCPFEPSATVNLTRKR